MHTLRLVILYALAAWIAFVAIRIEVLTKAAGFTLPIGEAMSRGREHGGSGRWRASRMDESLWREFYIQDADGQPISRPLTPAETAQMTRHIARANANADLYDFVHYFGWALQYVVVFVVLLLSIGWIFETRPRRGLVILYLIPSLVAAAGGFLAVNRGYFTSVWSGI